MSTSAKPTLASIQKRQQKLIQEINQSNSRNKSQAQENQKLRALVKRKNTELTRRNKQNTSIKNYRPLPKPMSNNNNRAQMTLDPMSAINLKRGSFSTQWNKYLNGLLDPKLTDQYIPDFCMFPFTTLQSKTVCEITSSSAGAFLMLATPYMTETGLFFNGSIAPATSPIALVNGVQYGPGAAGGTIFANTVYPSVKTQSNSYRIVSMQIAVTYIAPTITAQGRMVTACLPPTTIGAYSLNDFTSLANYNYSFQGAALQGATQIWFPDGPNSQEMIEITFSGASLDLPFIAVACDGLPANTKVMTITITQNYEVFSTAQILTAPKGSRVTSSTAIDHAGSTLNAVYESNGGGHPGSTQKEHKSFLSDALRIGGEIAKTALPLISAMLI